MYFNSKKYKTLMIKIILLKHGQSQWNLENRFTGWKDVSLTKKAKMKLDSQQNKLKI